MTYPIPNEALDDRISIVGMSGSGKTYAASGAVERLLVSGARVVIIDPLGVWWGLRLQKGGKLPSRFDVPIFGGPRGDLALTEHAGALIGETVAGMAQSCIVDLSLIGTRAGERRFMLAFLNALYRGINGAAVHVVFDEADMWAPQRLLDKDGDAAKLLGMMETIVRRGRVRGFIPWLITQRPAVLSKDVLSQSDGIVAMKLTAEQDRNAIGGWIEGQADRQDGKAILASLPSLARGGGVVWFPARGILETVAFPLKETFDSSRAPKRGETRSNAALPPLDIGKLRERLAAVETETKANDPKALRAEIAKLKAEIVNRADDRTAHNEAYLRGIEVGAARAMRDVASLCEPVILAMQKAGQAVYDAANAAEQFSAWAAAAEPAKARAPAPTPSHGPPRANAPAPRAAPARPLPAADADGLTKPQIRILQSLSFWRSIGEDQPTRDQVAAVAGYRPGSGNFNNLIGGLSSSGRTSVPQPGRVSLCGDFDALTAAEAREKLLSVFDGPQRRLVDAALARGQDMTRSDLAEAAGYQAGSGNFNNIVGSLTSIDVLQRPAPGRVQMSDWARMVLS